MLALVRIKSDKMTNRLQEKIFNSVAYETMTSFDEVRLCYKNLDKNIENVIRHIRHARMLDVSITDPIETTKATLLKLGFNFSKDLSEGNDDRFWISSNKNHIIELYYETQRGCYAMNYNGVQFCEVRYLHHLMNLYFDITKEELELK